MAHPVSPCNKATSICNILKSIWAIPVCAFCDLHKRTGGIIMAGIKAISPTLKKKALSLH